MHQFVDTQLFVFFSEQISYHILFFCFNFDTSSFVWPKLICLRHEMVYT